MSDPSQDFQQTFEQVMINFAKSKNNTDMKQNEEIIKQFLARKNSSYVLASILQESTNEIARQMAAIFIRRRIVEMWSRQDTEGRGLLQEMLLDRLSTEPVRSVRKVLIGVIGTLMRAISPNWPEVFILLDRAMEDGDAEVRELGCYLLIEITEQLAHRIKRYAEEAYNVLQIALTDPSPTVRIVGLRAASLVIISIYTNKLQANFADLLPHMLSIMYSCLRGEIHTNDADAVAVQTFDAFAILIEERSKIIVPHIVEITNAMMEVFTNADFEESTRSSAAQLIQSAILTRPKLLLKDGFIEASLPAIFDLCTEFDPDEHEELRNKALQSNLLDSMDYVEFTITAVATRLIDAMAGSFPDRIIFQPLIDKVVEWSSSKEWQHRRVAVIVLGVMAEGCTGVMQDNLQQVLDLLFEHVNDPSPYVREGTAHSLALMSDHLIPRIRLFHSIIIPVCITMLADESKNVVYEASLVLEAYLEELSTEVFIQYLDSTMQAVGDLLSAVTDEDSYVQERLLNVVGSLAHAAKEEFIPFVDTIIPSLLDTMELTSDHVLRLRACANTCFGRIALAVGAEAIEPYLKRALNAAVSSLDFHDSTDLRESFFRFFLHIVQVFPQNEDVLSLVRGVIQLVEDTVAGPEAIQNKKEQEGLEKTLANVYAHEENSDDDDDENENDDENDFDDDDDDDDNDIDDDNDDGTDDDDDDDDVDDTKSGTHFRISTSLIELKSAAIDCLGFVVAYCPQKVVKQLDEISYLLRMACGHFHPTISTSAINALINLVKAYIAIYPPIPGPTEDSPSTLQPEMRNVYDQLITLIITIIRTHPNKQLVGYCCSTVCSWCVILGAPAVLSHADALMQGLLLILQGKAECQLDEDGNPPNHNHNKGTNRNTTNDDDYENGDDEEEDHDHILVDECADTIAAIAGALGSKHFKPYIDNVMKEFIRYMASSRPPMDQILGFGAVCEIIRKLDEDDLSKYVGKMVPRIKKAAVGGSRGVQRNVAFLIGLIMENCPSSAGQYMEVLLDLLNEFFSIERGNPENDEVIDNACSALCRAIRAFPNDLPLNEILSALYEVLPIKEDHNEDEIVYGTIITLLTEHHAPEAIDSVANILEICAKVLLPTSGCTDDIRQSIVDALKEYQTYIGITNKGSSAVVQKERNKYEQGIQKLPDNLRKVLVEALE